MIKDTIDWSQTAHRRAAQYTDALSKLCARADLTSSRYLSVVPIGLAGIDTHTLCHTHTHTHTHSHSRTLSTTTTTHQPTHPCLSRRCLLGVYTCVLVLLYMCPHTCTYVSSYYYVCPCTTIYVSSSFCLGRLSCRKQHERNSNPTQRKKSLAGPLSVCCHVAAATE